VKALGVDDLVLTSGRAQAKDMIEHFTIIRRAAIKKNFKPSAIRYYPLRTLDDSGEREHRRRIGTMKYASIIILNTLKKWKMLALPVVRQNIYTDPQVPMQVACQHLQDRRRKRELARS